MTEIQQETHLQFPLDFRGQESLTKLAKWSKFVGIMNILVGIFYTLTIFVMSIPTVVIGVIYILIGTKLNSASAQLKFSLAQKDSDGFVSAIDHIRESIFLNGVLFIISIVVVGLVLLSILIFGSVFWDLFYETTRDYSLM